MYWSLLAWSSTAVLSASLLAVVVSPVPLAPNAYIPGLVAFPLVGGLVIMRRPDNGIGRQLVLAGSWFALATAAQTYHWVSLVSGPLPANDAAAWLATWAYWPAAALLVMLVVSFPSGSVASRRLVWAIRLMIVTIGLLTVGVMILPEPVNEVFFDAEVVNPWAVVAELPSPTPGEALPVVVTLFLVIALLDLAFRWRASSGVERIQMRWFGLGLVLCIVLASASSLAGAAGVDDQFVNVALWGFGFGVLPVSIGVAVTRYRLYDIDHLVSRTVSYTLVIGTMAAVFAGVAVWIPQMLDLPGNSPVLVAAATLAAAALFNPLRRRLQSGVDRRFNRSRYNTQEEVDRLAQRLHSGLDFDDLREETLDVVARTIQPSAAAVWIKGVGG
jgi:hypothetical protein